MPKSVISIIALWVAVAILGLMWSTIREVFSVLFGRIPKQVFLLAAVIALLLASSFAVLPSVFPDIDIYEFYDFLAYHLSGSWFESLIYVWLSLPEVPGFFFDFCVLDTGGGLLGGATLGDCISIVLYVVLFFFFSLILAWGLWRLWVAIRH